MALPDNVLGTIEQQITFRCPEPTEDNLVLVTARSKALRGLHEDMTAFMPVPGSESDEPSLRQITLPMVGLQIENVIKVSHSELNEYEAVDADGELCVMSVRVIFTQAVLSQD